MKLSDLIHIDSVVPELKATDRNGVIRELLQSLAEQGALPAEHVEALARATIARENQGSTGFGKGVAVPHVKHASVPRMMATIGRSEQGVDFAALDRAPVYTSFCLAQRKNPSSIWRRWSAFFATFNARTFAASSGRQIPRKRSRIWFARRTTGRTSNRVRPQSHRGRTDPCTRQTAIVRRSH